MILLMSVNPGFGGQKFIPAILRKLKAARKMIDQSGLPIRLEVDGGVTINNIAKIKAAGADTFVAGSAIFNSKDYVDTIAKMSEELFQYSTNCFLNNSNFNTHPLTQTRCAMFDLDGTLVNSAPDIAISMNASRSCW